MKQAITFSFLSFLLCLCLTGCERKIDMDDYPQSSMRSIIKFSLLPDYNLGNIFTEHKGIIDQENKTITLHLHPQCDLTALRPEITFSPMTKVEPGNYHAHDFSSLSASYCAIAENGKKSYYDVICKLDYRFKGVTLAAVYLPDVINPETGRPVRATFNNAGNGTVRVPASVRSSMKFNFEIDGATSAYCTFDKDTSAYYNMTAPTNSIPFTVTSDDGSTSKTYTVWVSTLN